MSPPLNSTGSNEPASSLNLVVLDQTLVVFDVEQPRNASQILHLRKLPGAAIVAWRFQTNAPTRYIVCPNGGILSDDHPVKVLIELVDNRYNPQHKLTLQAVSISNVDKFPEIWNDEEAMDPQNVQSIYLELGTTLMNLDNAQNPDEMNASRASLSQILDLSQSVGSVRVKELEDLLAMLESDNDTLTKNIDQATHLKEVLNKQLESKKLLSMEISKKQSQLEAELQKGQIDMHRDEAELRTLRERRVSQPPPCCLM